MSWHLKKGQKGWEIWNGEEKFQECVFPFLSLHAKVPSVFSSLELLFKWSKEEERKKVKAYGLRLLGMRAYSSAGLRKKMHQKGYQTEVIEDLIAWLQESGFLQDDQFLASAVIREFERGYGPKYIQLKLQSKGLVKEAVRKQIEKTLSREKQLNRICEIIAKKEKGQDFKERRKIIASLLRKGFDLDLIYEALR